MTRALLLALLSAAVVPAAGASTATLRGVDVYRSARLDAARAEQLYGPRIREYVSLRNAGQASAGAKAEKVRRQIEAEVAKRPGVAFASVRVVEYYTSVDRSLYMSIDVVDESDRSRLAFSPAPAKRFGDPGGLLAAWKKYDELGARFCALSLERRSCPGFYCTWGDATPELAALQKKLADGVPAKVPELRAVLLGDADGDKRASALYALSYSKSGEALVEDCLRALKDPDGAVRVAALQILADIANSRKELKIDLARVLPALDDPLGTVRVKVLGLLVALSGDKSQRARLLAAAPRLAELLKLRQPDSSELAFTVLGLVSRKDYDRRDLQSWDRWAAGAAMGRDD